MLKVMKESAKERQIKIYKKMSADKKITIVSDFFEFAKVLKNDRKTISRQNKPDFRRA